MHTIKRCFCCCVAFVVKHESAVFIDSLYATEFKAISVLVDDVFSWLILRHVSLLQIVFSEFPDKVGCGPAVDLHGCSLGGGSEIPVDGGIPVRSIPALMAGVVAEHHPHAIRFALLPVRASKRLVPVQFPVPSPAQVTGCCVLLNDGGGVAVAVKHFGLSV
jgi:hypothetical protein